MRLLLGCVLGAVVLAGLLLTLPQRGGDPGVTRPEPRSPPPATPRAVARTATTAPSEPPPELPPTVPIAPLAVAAVAAPPPPTPVPIDANHATDLFADLLARQETGSGAFADMWRRFRDEPRDEAWAAAVMPKLHAAMDAWMRTLPETVRAHVAVVQAECRATLCQILVADNDSAGFEMRAALEQDWASASAALNRQAWWRESGFVSQRTDVTSADGHALMTTYLERGAESVRAEPPQERRPPAG